MVMMTSRQATRRPRRHNRGDQGAAAVEFALVIPVMLLVVFAIMEFGFAFTQSSALASGARQGARYGVVNLLSTHTCGEVIREVRNAATTIGMPEQKIKVTVARNSTTVCEAPVDQATPASAVTPCTDTTNAPDNTLNVTASYKTSIGIPLAFNADVTLTGKGAFRCEYN